MLEQLPVKDIELRLALVDARDVDVAVSLLLGDVLALGVHHHEARVHVPAADGSRARDEGALVREVFMAAVQLQLSSLGVLEDGWNRDRLLLLLLHDGLSIDGRDGGMPFLVLRCSVDGRFPCLD